MSNNILPEPLSRLTSTDQKCRQLTCGESLFRQGSRTTGLFYLVSGTIDLSRMTKSGRNVVIHRARSGDTFAEASLFSDTYHCTALAVNNAEIIECKRAAILKLMETDPVFSQSMICRFAQQIQEGRRRIELLSMHSAEERIMTALSDGMLIDDLASFADIIGLAPETVYRTLRKLTKKGVIEKLARGVYRA